MLIGFVLCPLSAFPQSRIPESYRGNFDYISRGVLDGNEIVTNYRNHGEMARWGDLPWGVWPKNGGRHLDGMGFIFAAEVIGERGKWSDYYGENTPEYAELTPVIINYRNSGSRKSPYTGDTWGWLPLTGFHNPFRRNSSGESESIPATSTDEISWPDFWPDKLRETTDSGWEGYWNGFRGKGLATGHQETFYVMDDHSDYEYAFGIETDRPHSNYGVYYPSPSDSSIGGLGLQTEVRTFQFWDVLSKDILFTQYRTTNVSEKDLKNAWTGLIYDIGMGTDENDDYVQLQQQDNLIVIWDSDSIGISTLGEEYDLGVVGLLLLEHSFDETNGIDDDNDGIIDESKFNGPGELIEGKDAIDAYLEANYDMEQFYKSFADLNNHPAYQAQRWWTGDEDLDWVAHEDFNQNGKLDEGELYNDVGRDGLGPWHANYPGPDEGEGDGIPTQGEPNFGELDMLEAETRELSFFAVGTNTYYENLNTLAIDNWLFSRIKESHFDEGDNFDNMISSDEPLVLTGVGPFELKKNTSSYFITALVFGKDEEDLMKNVRLAKLIYESDYGQSQLLTGTEDQPDETPKQITLSQNYPNPFNPTTNIRFSLSNTAPVSLNIYDITGRLVSTVIQEELYNSGRHTVQFNAGNLSSGVYIYRLNVNGEVFTKKLTLIK